MVIFPIDSSDYSFLIYWLFSTHCYSSNYPVNSIMELPIYYLNSIDYQWNWIYEYSLCLLMKHYQSLNWYLKFWEEIVPIRRSEKDCSKCLSNSLVHMNLNHVFHEYLIYPSYYIIYFISFTETLYLSTVIISYMQVITSSDSTTMNFHKNIIFISD